MYCIYNSMYYICISNNTKTLTDMTLSAIFTAAHKTAKTGNSSISYRVRFAQALNAAYAAAKAPVVDARLAPALEAIQNGAKFNGTVYTKKNGKWWMLVHIYLDGKLVKLDNCLKSDVAEFKALAERVLNGASVTPAGKNEWLVNEKKVVNNLNYGDMWLRYGTDFE